MTTFSEDASLTAYDLGPTPAQACLADQRFSYCLYVPRHHDRRQTRLLVAVHGSERDNAGLRDRFAALAERHNLMILAPLFPCGITDPMDRENYKYIAYGDIRFDAILLSMVDEVCARYDLSTDPFTLFGFSGGAHFAHRFLYLHPERLASVSICSPGSVTILDDPSPWWVGTGDLTERFGKPLDIPAMRRVHAHLAVGGDDLSAAGIIHKPGSSTWMEGANDTGATRVERARSLHRAFERARLNVRFEVLPGVRHERDRLVEAGARFFDTVLGGVDVAT